MISIIIPTLNEEKIIVSTINKLKSALTIDHEIIVSDSLSTDKTVELARKYADKVVIFSGIGKLTISKIRNNGARAAVGDFFVFMDADCVIKDADNSLKKCLARFEKDKNLVAITGGLRVFPEFETRSDRIFFGLVNVVERFSNNVLHRGEAAGKFQMIRREVFERLGGFREDLVTREDSDMFLRLSKIGKTFFDSAITIFHGGRRAHAIGWPKLLFIWMMNTVWVSLFNKAKTEEWKPVR